MKSNNLLSVVIAAIVYLSIIPGRASATPTLGVAVDGGIYAYTDPSALTDEFVTYFASSIEPAVGDLEGFIIPSSGGYLTVFSYYNPALIDIYFLASTDSSYRPISFGGQTLVNMGDTGQADGYNLLPYFGRQLPTDLSYWSTHIFEASKTYYLYEGQIIYSGDLDNKPLGYYFFSAADINGTAGLQFAAQHGSHDDFSPKTTSAGGHTPEPTTLSLLGLGLLWLRFKKKFMR